MNERRRTLLFSGGYKIPTEIGVYIETIDHKFYTVDEWDTSNNANVNSVAVIPSLGPENRPENYGFRISNNEPIGLPIDSTDSVRYETVLHMHNPAHADFDGKSNTEKMVSLNPNPEDAAGYCNSFTFPDGTTKGYLPSIGEIKGAQDMINEIDAAFNAFSGCPFGENYYLSSTFCGLYDISPDKFVYTFFAQYVAEDEISEECVDAYEVPYLRPFGPLYS